jgi:hypothetical protein
LVIVAKSDQGSPDSARAASLQSSLGERRTIFIGAEIAPVKDLKRAISAASRVRPDYATINRSMREEKQ